MKDYHLSHIIAYHTYEYITQITGERLSLSYVYIRIQISIVDSTVDGLIEITSNDLLSYTSYQLQQKVVVLFVSVQL